MDFDFPASAIIDVDTLDTTGGANPNSLSIDGTGAVTVTRGTTAQRPTGVNGMLRYNSTTNQLEAFVNSAWVAASLGSMIFSRGGTLILSASASAINVIIWRAPFACTVTNVRGYRVGGTGATVNARRNGSSNHLASAVSLTSADTWTDGGAVQNTAYVAGDKLEIMIVSLTGNPTQCAVQVDFTRTG